MTQYAIGTLFEHKEADSPTRGKHPDAKHLVAEFFPADELSKPVSESLDPARGFAVHAFDDLAAVPSELDLIASGPSLGDISLDARNRSVLEKRAGFLPTGNTLSDFLVECWGSQSDPTGQNRNLPAMPALFPGQRQNGPQLVWLHSLEPGGILAPPIKFLPFARDGVMPGISSARIEAALAHQNAQAATRNRDLAAKILEGQLLEVIGLGRHEVQKDDLYKRILPESGDGSDLQPGKATTRYARLFSDEANNDTISSATEFVGSSNTDGLEIINGSGVSNKNASAAVRSLRLDSDLSSENHTIAAIMNYRSASSGNGGLATRWLNTSAVNTCYRMVGDANGGFAIASFAAAVSTTLVSAAQVFGGGDHFVRATSIGASHSFEIFVGSARYILSVTSTTHEGSDYVRCGLQSTSSTTATNNHYWRNVAWQDYIGGGSNVFESRIIR